MSMTKIPIPTSESMSPKKRSIPIGHTTRQRNAAATQRTHRLEKAAHRRENGTKETADSRRQQIILQTLHYWRRRSRPLCCRLLSAVSPLGQWKVPGTAAHSGRKVIGENGFIHGSAVGGEVCECGQCFQATVLEDYEESTAQGRHHCGRSQDFDHCSCDGQKQCKVAKSPPTKRRR